MKMCDSAQVPAQSSTRPSPGHSVPEAYRGQPGAAGLGQSPTSHPGSGNRPQQRDCGIDRAGQGTHQGLLHAAGVPVPKGRPVDDVVDAWAAACEIGLPVVVKPRDGNQGKGVTVNIESREHLEIAYAAATEFREDIMVERFIPGHDFRLLVIGDRMVAAARRDPPHVIGDGVSTIVQLCRQGQQRPAQRHRPLNLLTRIRLDESRSRALPSRVLTRIQCRQWAPVSCCGTMPT